MTPDVAAILIAVGVIALVAVFVTVFSVMYNRHAAKDKSVSEEPVSEETEEVAEEPVSEETEEVTEEPVSEETEEVAEEPVPEETEEVAEEPVSEETEEVAEEPVSEETEEVAEEPVSEETEEVAEEPVPEETEEVAEEPVSEETEEVAEEPVPEETVTPVVVVAEEPVAEEPVPIDGSVRVRSANAFVPVQYDKSYRARLIQADDTLKSFYSELKNHALSCGLKSRVSWKGEAFRVGREVLMRMCMRGKTLCIYLAIDPNELEESKYKVEDVSEVGSYAEVPSLYRIKNARRVRYAKELITLICTRKEVKPSTRKEEDFVAEMPYEETEALLEKGLVKRVVTKGKGAPAEEAAPAEVPEEVPEETPAPVKKPAVTLHEVRVAQAHEMISDVEAASYVETGERYSDTSRKTVVNVDDLGKYFEEGEKVTLETMKERIPRFDQSATYVKVLARGVLTKALEVEADDFSLDAVKMITITGGKVVRTRRI